MREHLALWLPAFLLFAPASALRPSQAPKEQVRHIGDDRNNATLYLEQAPRRDEDRVNGTHKEDIKFIPTAMAMSFGDFNRISSSQIQGLIYMATHPNTVYDWVRQGSNGKTQTVSYGMFVPRWIVKSLITWAVFTALSLVWTRYRVIDPWSQAEASKGLDPAVAVSESPSVSKNWKLFMYSACCPGVLFAETAVKTGIMTYWAAFWAMTVLWLFRWLAFWVCTWFMVFDWAGISILYHRRKFRAQLHLDQDSACSRANECCCAMVCSGNVVMQEALLYKASLQGKDP